MIYFHVEENLLFASRFSNISISNYRLCLSGFCSEISNCNFEAAQIYVLAASQRK